MTSLEKLEHLSRRFWVETFAMRDVHTHQQSGFDLQLHITAGFYVWNEFPAETLEQCIDLAYERGKDAPLLLTDEAIKRDREFVRRILEPMVPIHQENVEALNEDVALAGFCSEVGEIEEITEEPTPRERRDWRFFLWITAAILAAGALWLVLIYGHN